MQVLILEAEAGARVAMTNALKKKGFICLPAERIEMAMEVVRSTAIDILVAAHKLGDRYTFSVASAAEYYNPRVETILLSDTCGAETAEYADLIPSLHCVLGRPASPDMVARFALSAAEFQVTGRRSALPLVARKGAPLVLGSEDRVPPVEEVPAFLRALKARAARHETREVA